MLKSVLEVVSQDLAIDLGTTNTLIYVPGRGIIVDEPSVVAIRGKNGTREVVAVGAKAKAMLGRAPEGIEILRPMRDGVIADFVAAEEMMRRLIKLGRKRSGLLRPRMLVCVPASSTPVERRAIYESALAAGARKAFLIEEPVAAALGAGLPVDEPKGCMVVDVGGGTTDIAVLVSGGVMRALSIRCAGNAMDEAIIRYVRREHFLLIGESNAEKIKIEAGTALETTNGKAVDVHIRGRDMRRGAPTEIVLRPGDIARALNEPIAMIAEAIAGLLEQLPPEVSADVVDRGICLTGGGALLDRLGDELKRRTGVHFYMAPKPQHSVVLGCGLVLEARSRYEDFLIIPR